jgi:hypothetical protein
VSAPAASAISGKRPVQSMPLRVSSRTPGGVAADHQPEAVVLDLVNPAGPIGGRSAGDGRQGSMKPAGGGRRERSNMRNR